MKALRTALLAAGLAFLAAPASALAQEAPGGVETPKKLITIQFPGGSLADYGTAVQTAAGWANIVMDPRSAEVRIPRCELRSVSVSGALEAARAMLQQTTEEVGVSVDVINQGGAPVFTVRVHFSRPKSTGGSDEEPGDRYVVISLREILAPGSALKPEAVLTAVDTALGLSVAGGPKAVVKYHSDTSLLIVQGTQTQVNLVREVVEAIRTDVRRGSAKPAGAVPSEAVKSGPSIEDRIAEAESELARLRKMQKDASGSPK